MLPPDLHKISPAHPRQENIYTEVNVKQRARALYYNRIAFSRSHGRHSEYAASPSEQFAPFVLFLTAMTHIFPSRANPYFIVNPSPTSWDPRAKMQLRDARHPPELLSFAYSTQRNMQPSLICHRAFSPVVPCRISSTKTYLYVEVIISIPESVSAARFTYTRRRK